RPQEVAMAESYIQTLETTFDPERYHDEYRVALEKLIEAKTEGVELAPVETPAPAGEVVDLMSALQASVDAAKKEREGGRAAKYGEKATKSTKKSTEKTTEKGGKKAAAKKSASGGRKTAKKSTAKSGSGGKKASSGKGKKTGQKSTKKSA